MAKAQTVLVVPDTHITYEGSPEGGIDPRAESVLFQAIKVVKPDTCLHLGDIGEWESVSPWQWKKRKRPPFEYIAPKIEAEAKAINTWLDKLESSLSKVGCSSIKVAQGNHEIWADSFAEEEARPEFTSRALLKADARGYEWHDYGQFGNLGKLHFTHGGHFSGQHHAYKTVVGLGASSIYGHFHNIEFAHVMRLGGEYGAWCLGCLCKLDKKFLKHRPTDWSHCLGIIHVESDGTFHVEVVDIFEGVGWVYGKRLEAK